jgi:protein SCO1
MKHPLLLAFALAALLLGACEKKDEAFEMLGTPPPQTDLPRHWLIPDFSLTERDGRKITGADLRGKVWVADFFYTSCPGPCPMMSSRLSDLQKVTAGLPDVALVSISADPIKDTPDVLKEYAAKFHAGPGWLFLTGDKTAIYELANRGFKLGLSEDGRTAEEPVTHSTKLVLVDKNGYARGFYDALTPTDTSRLLVDLERLRKESR